MSDQELKKKIVEIINSWAEQAEESYSPDGASVYNPYNAAELADALIAAGIGDVSDLEVKCEVLQRDVDNLTRTLEEGREELEEAKHRAEVTGRIAKQACSVIFTGEINGEHWTEKLRDYKREHGLIGYGLSPDMLYDCLREITEKELVEEGSNEKEGTRQVYRKRPRTGDNT